MNNIFNEPAKFIKGVGPKKAEKMEKLEIFTLFDLIYHFPKDYLNRSDVVHTYSVDHGQFVTVCGRVMGKQELKPRKNLSIVKLSVRDNYSTFFAVWFNQRHILSHYEIGDKLLITGRADKSYRGNLHINVTECEKLDEEKDTSLLLPIYSLTEGITQRQMRVIMQNALSKAANIEEFLPAKLLEKYKLPSLYDALKNIHFPENIDAAEQARRRFIFEEFFLLQLALTKKRYKIQKFKKNYNYKSGGKRGLIDSFLKNLPFEPTEDQKRVFEEIQKDMDSPYPMNRLLQGDVGSGKTLISTLMLLKAVDAGLQGAFMAPTEILAEQHYINLSSCLKAKGGSDEPEDLVSKLEAGFQVRDSYSLFSGFKDKASAANEGYNYTYVNVALLTGKTPRSQRKKLLESLKIGEIDILIGTHALIQDDVVFKNLAAVVIDEQHRFGVRQRMKLLSKGCNPDILIMTATPIPRTLALTAYGDLDISVIYKLPPGRKLIRTYHITNSKLNKLYSFIQKEVKQGRQAYIVCPLIEESKVLEAKAATELADELMEMSRDEGSLLYGLRIGLLHGKLKIDEKKKVMEAFRKGEIDILVSTTVIEVGVDVPNASVMVIMDAERFGLAQLHQLRGRVGRGDSQSYCILVSEPKSKESRERINAFVNITDGFMLAEEDLKLRGPGEFLGTKQSGLPRFKIADIVRDQKALIAAKTEAEAVLRDGEDENKSEILFDELRRRFKDSLEEVSN